MGLADRGGELSRTGSPAASSSGWRWRGPWPTIPSLVLADEPTGNLDLETGLQVLDLLDRLTRQAGKTMVMVTHSPEVVGLADRVFRIEDCRLVEQPARRARPSERPLLWRSSLRHLVRHPWQFGLAVLGVALGVAVVVSIDLANASARRAFTLSTEAVTGKATHQVVGGPGGIPDDAFRRLVVEAGDRAARRRWSRAT